MERLPALARRAKVFLSPAPRILRTLLDGAPVHAPTPVTVNGTLSSEASWVVTLTDDQGAVLASAHGEGTKPALSWSGTRDDLPLLPGSTVSWKLTATDGFHPAAVRSGSFEVGLPLVG